MGLEGNEFASTPDGLNEDSASKHIDPLKTKINRNYLKEFSLYLTVNTLLSYNKISNVHDVGIVRTLYLDLIYFQNV
jgi:hypothetical protein